MRRVLLLIGLLLLAMLITACPGGGATPPAATPPPGGEAPAVTGDPENGRQLYIAQGCGGCHTIEGVEGATGQVCPVHTNLATTAAQVIQQPGYTGQANTAAEYIRESIVNPNVYIAEGYQPNVMPQTYGETLSDEQVNDLVAFLMQQE